MRTCDHCKVKPASIENHYAVDLAKMRTTPSFCVCLECAKTVATVDESVADCLRRAGVLPPLKSKW